MNDNKFDALGIIKEIMGFIGVTVGVFAWMMLMQLIISFVALSYLHMKLETMIIVAVCVTVAFDVYYVIHRIHKKRERKEILRRIGKA